MKSPDESPSPAVTSLKTGQSHGEGCVPDLVILGQTTIDDIYLEGGKALSLGTPGGDALYSAVGATMWPIRVGVVTCIGDDYPRDKLAHATCRPEFTDWSGLKFFEGPSIHDVAVYYADGRRTYTFYDETLLETLTPRVEDVPVQMEQAGFVHLAPADTRLQLQLLQVFMQRGSVVSLDVETHFFRDDPSPVFQMLSRDPIFVPSLEHVEHLSGVRAQSPLDIWPWVASCGARWAIIKRGAAGAWVFDAVVAKLWSVGVVPDLDIVDPTGAGDGFCGGFMAGLILTGNPVHAAAYGAVSASFIVESLGATKPPHFSPGLAQQRLYTLLDQVPTKPLNLPSIGGAK